MAKDEAPAGAPMWMVTFADLMSLLVCFFVLIISFSVPDTEKIKIVAGSMNDAFGFSREAAVTGMIEVEGNPQFRWARNVVPLPLDHVIGPIDEDGREVSRETHKASEWQELDEDLLEELNEDFEDLEIEPLTEEQQFEMIEDELLAAIENTEELQELKDNLVIENLPEGLRIQMIDQARLSMFPLGSPEMYQPARDLLGAVVAAVSRLPNKIWITGHTDALVFKRKDGYDNWSLSIDRANATRKTLIATGLDPERVASVIGKADTEHMVPDRPTDPRNRRISMTLLREQPKEGAAQRSDGFSALTAPPETQYPAVRSTR
ncbi:MAG: flagellar motor protein MotB [Geminicoccaceae bacterium]